ncbi:M24 family metallopeptidase [Streptomyces sp. NPDC020379]|uniref:M24 family metallopeptidase n=1 Tax=Streptomyces sp. NPDC020379 TaxID=3365071 RepID=UPI0037A54EAB
MVLTVEPGVYFQPDDTTCRGTAGLRGIGVRIEGDLVVTADGVPAAVRCAVVHAGCDRGVDGRRLTDGAAG